MSYKPDLANDLNEICGVMPTPGELGAPTDWWTVTAHGFPVNCVWQRRSGDRSVKPAQVQQFSSHSRVARGSEKLP
jgi:hypothetical protein